MDNLHEKEHLTPSFQKGFDSLFSFVSMFSFCERWARLAEEEDR